MGIKAKLTEMKDADVRYVSLVKRAANRIPFRVIKSDKDQQESGMIDLTKLGRALKGDKQPEKPTIAAIVVMDQGEELMAEITTALKAEGFVVDKITKNEDDSVVFAQIEGDITDDAHIVKVSDQMLVVMKGFDQYSQKMSDNANFAEVVAARGFYQDIDVASYAFQDIVRKAMYDAESPADAGKRVREVGTQFLNYVEAVASGLPTIAFKAEKSVSEIVAKGKGRKPMMSDEERESMMSDEDKAKAKKDEANSEAKPEGEVKDEGKPAESVTKDEGKDTPKAEDPTKLITEAVTGAVTTLKGELGDMIKAAIDSATNALTERVDQIARKSEDAAKAAEEVQKALKSTVVAGAGAGDTPPRQVEQKAEDLRSGAYWDTAMLPRR